MTDAIVVVAIVGMFLAATYGPRLLKWCREYFGARRRAQLEQEVREAQAELYERFRVIAAELLAGSHEARKALIRESFLAAQEARNVEK